MGLWRASTASSGVGGGEGLCAGERLVRAPLPTLEEVGAPASLLTAGCCAGTSLSPSLSLSFPPPASARPASASSAPIPLVGLAWAALPVGGPGTSGLVSLAWRGPATGDLAGLA